MVIGTILSLSSAALGIRKQPSFIEDEPFKFGPGEVIRSNRRGISILAIKNNLVLWPTSVIEGPLPALASRASMQSLKIKIDTEHSTVDIGALGLKDIPMYETAAGHPAIFIDDFRDHTPTSGGR